MARAPLDPESLDLWRRVARTVRPMHRRVSTPAGAPSVPTPAAATAAKVKGRVPPPRTAHSPASKLAAHPPHHHDATLDGGWDRRLRKGEIAPDRTIDLHGLRLDDAHVALERAIGRALADGARVLLVIAGRERPQQHRGDSQRGVIRASIPDWLRYGRHARDIAAVRGAHPRHGGGGALYVILKRRR